MQPCPTPAKKRYANKETARFAPDEFDLLLQEAEQEAENAARKEGNR